MTATMTLTFPSILSSVKSSVPAPAATTTTIPTSTTTTTAANNTSTTSTSTKSCCPGCGLALPASSDSPAALLAAQKQIEELQSQVRLLNQKAATAADRLADYEDELSRLRSAANTSGAAAKSTTTATPTTDNRSQTPEPNGSPRSSGLLPSTGGVTGRISQLLTPRKSVGNLASAGSGGAPDSSSDELLLALTREKQLRVAAEGKLNDTSREVEELSVTLFEQANEMVANERRARAKLEERVTVLERRDAEKRERLDRLEGAMGRIDRVRALLEKSGRS
jgi:hypothetical protein